MTRLLATVAMLALAGCGSPEQSAPDEAPAPQPAPVPEPAPQRTQAPAQAPDVSVLDSRDCRTVAQAYIDAVARRDFAFAARVWNDPTIDAVRLAALFVGYREPLIDIGDMQQEGAAGSLYCTVTGALGDAADPATPLREGEIVLRRANDVPGATAEQLRWTIRSSTFIERMERSGTGEPA